MTAYIIRRLVLMIPTLLGMTVMVFLIARLAPGRPGATQHEAAAPRAATCDNAARGLAAAAKQEHG